MCAVRGKIIFIFCCFMAAGYCSDNPPYLEVSAKQEGYEYLGGLYCKTQEKTESNYLMIFLFTKKKMVGYTFNCDS